MEKEVAELEAERGKLKASSYRYIVQTEGSTNQRTEGSSSLGPDRPTKVFAVSLVRDPSCFFKLQACTIKICHVAKKKTSTEGNKFIVPYRAAWTCCRP